MSNIIMNRHKRNDGILQVGFSLIELMTVVAIIAILTAIAYPSYTRYVTRTNRTAAEGCLSQYANYMERFYTTNLRYDLTPDPSGTGAGTPNPVIGTTPTATQVLDCAGTSQTANNYQYTVQVASPTTYTVQATPIGTQLNRDTQCGALTVNQVGTRLISGSTGTLAQCWGG